MYLYVYNDYMSIIYVRFYNFFFKFSLNFIYSTFLARIAKKKTRYFYLS